MWIVQALVRSQGQIFFQRAVLSGLLVLLALAVASPWLVGFAVLGAAVQTGVSVLLRRPRGTSARLSSCGGDRGSRGRTGPGPGFGSRSERHGADRAAPGSELVAGQPQRPAPSSGSHRASALAMSSLSTDATARRDAADGIHGFCGALTGCAAFLACGPSTAALVWTFLGSALCALLVRALERLRIFNWLPMLTGPFCAVSTALNPVFARWHRDAESPGAPPFELLGPIPDLVTGTVRASAQVLLTDHLITGLLVLAIMFFAGVREGLWSLVGALTATALGFWLLGWQPTMAGLAGYCGFLTALALGAVFPRNDAARAVRVLVPLVGACLTVPLWWALQQAGMAVYTWPFVLTTWAILFAQRRWARRERAGAAS
ncbi:hypothetical protein CKW39_13575 [Kocuria sp. WRN011]|uniref:urea transporter n=1 Tax=Kocuria sp. WRN011 TaxID=2029858 RepID=UPI000BAFB50B|nr:urea transporter [Kocuria sp. WRN011]PBB07383.1 hypothetical protein CKW39_13575 [Kocuria sp. WRN011]